MNSIDTALATAHAEVKAELARTDTKASLLLAFVGAALAGTWSVATGTRLPLAALVVGGAGVLVLLAAVVLLLLTVRPNLGGTAPEGFPKWALLDGEALREDLAADDRTGHLRVLSRIAVAKFTRLRRAVDLVCAAGILLAAAAVIALAVRP